MKKCILIPDSFKGTISSEEVCAIIAGQVKKHFPACQVLEIPVADGGEGTTDCFLHALPGGEKVEVETSGPYGETIKAYYARFGKMAVVEMAAAAGLPMVEGKENPALTTTYGVGAMIRHAVENGAKEIILGLGGSCTNDAGCGCAAALGVEFYDEAGREFIPTGETMGNVSRIEAQKAKDFLEGITITAMCDVDNPMYGPNGAAYIYAPQKGADTAMVKMLDENLLKLAAVLVKRPGLEALPTVAGTGAAGAFGAGVIAFLGGQLKAGIETILDTVQFDDLLTGTDLVVTGEGKIDGQSLRGKVISGITARAKAKQVPVVAFVGDVGEGMEPAFEKGLTSVISINRVAVPFEIAKTRSKQDMRDTADSVFGLIKAAESFK